MTKRERLGDAKFKLLVGRNVLLMSTDAALVIEIQFQATCDAIVTQVFHGQKNLLYDKQPVVAGRPGSGLLKLIPSEEFQFGLDTIFIVDAAKEGKLIVSLWGKARSAWDGGEISISKKMQHDILRAAGWPKKSWSRFELTALVREKRR